MIIRLTIDSALYIARRLREPERRERIELLGEFDADAFGVACYQRPGVAYAALNQRLEPVVMGGLQATRPGQAAAWMAGTDRWPEVVREVTRTCRRSLAAALESSVHRVEVVSPAWFEEAHNWYRLLGLTHRAPLPGYGVNGEPWVLFARVRQTEEG